MALTTINSEGIEDGSLKNIDVKSELKARLDAAGL
jgi:hypothetical protein